MMPFGLIKAIILRSSIIVSAFAIFLISSYLYGPEGRGSIAFLNSFFLPVALFLSMGLGRVAYQEVSIDPSKTYATFRTLVSFIYILFGLAIIALACAFLLEQLFPFASKQWHIKYFLLFSGAFPYFLWQNNGNYLYAAINKSQIHDRIILATRSIQVVVLAACASIKVSLDLFLLTYGITGLLIFSIESGVLLYGQESQNKEHSISIVKNLKNLMRKAKWPYIDSIALAIAPTIFFIIGLNISNTDLGHYNFAVQLLGALIFPFTVIQVKIQEKLTRITKNEAKPFIKKTFISTILISLPIMSITLLIPTILPLVGLKSFEESGPILIASLLTIPLIGSLYVFQGIWVGTHNAKLSSLVNLSMGAVNLITALALVTQFGLWAGVIGSYVSYTLATILSSIALRKRMNTLFE